MATLVNLTPHAVDIITPDEVISIPSSGTVARCAQSQKKVGEINGIAVTRQTFGEVVDLPEREEGTIYIVSRLVAAACPDRDDLVIPGPLLRDNDGKVIGCDGLSVL